MGKPVPAVAKKQAPAKSPISKIWVCKSTICTMIRHSHLFLFRLFLIVGGSGEDEEKEKEREREEIKWRKEEEDGKSWNA